MSVVLQFSKQLLGDIIINGLVYAILRYLDFHWKAPWRGFFCSDISIMYPFSPPLMGSYFFFTSAFWIPILIVLVNSLITTYFTKEYRKTMLDVYKILSMYILGFNASRLTATIGKRSVGRLRPNFYSVCKPNVNCDIVSPYTYIYNYTCVSGSDFTRNSFPSQHSTVSFYVAVFVMLYLQKRSLKRGALSRNIKHFVQIILLQLAWLMAISRIRNFFHHESDVLAGIMIGTFWAVIAIHFFLKLDSNGEQAVTNDEMSANCLRLNRSKDSKNNDDSFKEVHCTSTN